MAFSGSESSDPDGQTPSPPRPSDRRGSDWRVAARPLPAFFVPIPLSLPLPLIVFLACSALKTRLLDAGLTVAVGEREREEIETERISLAWQQALLGHAHLRGHRLPPLPCGYEKVFGRASGVDARHGPPSRSLSGRWAGAGAVGLAERRRTPVNNPETRAALPLHSLTRRRRRRRRRQTT